MLELLFAFIMDNITSMTTIIMLILFIPIVMQRIVVHSTVSCYVRGFQYTSVCVFASLLCFSVYPCARVVVFYVRVFACLRACVRARISVVPLNLLFYPRVYQFRVFKKMYIYNIHQSPPTEG